MRQTARAALAAAVLLSAALLSGACGDDSDRATTRRPVTPPVPTPQPPPPAPAPAIDAAVAPLVPLAPLPTQLDANVPAVEFLGWTEDGRRFVLRATHGYDMEDLGGQNLLALVQVHDALTGAMIESFQIERIADASVDADDALSRAWREAQPAAKWKSFRASHPLVGRDAETTRGEWTLTADAADKAPYRSRFDVTADDSRIDVRWSGFDEDRLQRPAPRSPAEAPRVRVVARRAAVAHELIAVRAPWSYEEVNGSRDSDDPTVTGAIRAYWSPAGDRVLMVVSHRIRGAHEEHGDMADARWYVRTLGPQIKLVDAGAGADATHRAAARLAAAGLPVTAIETAPQPAKTSTVYFRGDARPLAERAAAPLGLAASVEKLAPTGWSTLVIVLAP